MAVDKKHIAAAILDMAVRMRAEAAHLERLAEKMVKEDDLGYATEAVASVTGIASTVRLDVLVSRIVRGVSNA